MMAECTLHTKTHPLANTILFQTDGLNPVTVDSMVKYLTAADSYQ